MLTCQVRNCNFKQCLFLHLCWCRLQENMSLPLSSQNKHRNNGQAVREDITSVAQRGRGGGELKQTQICSRSMAFYTQVEFHKRTLSLPTPGMRPFTLTHPYQLHMLPRPKPEQSWCSLQGDCKAGSCRQKYVNCYKGNVEKATRNLLRSSWHACSLSCDVSSGCAVF